MATVCYILSHYISHRQAGLQFQDCFRSLGVRLVDTPREADLVIIHNEPWSVAGYYRAFPKLSEKHVVAYSVWETDQLPESYRFNLSLTSEIWTCSAYCRDALAESGRPVSVVPHVVSVPEPNAEAELRMRERIGARDGEMLFYTIANVTNVRKGVDDLLRAFDGLFPSGEARLIVKSNVPMALPPASARDVVVITELLSDDDLFALHRVGDCFVSAHRSEAWGLGISEAMACGNLVVATAHGGNMDYMTTGNSLPVACQIEPIRAAEIKSQPDILTSDMHWAYVDPDDLRRQLRRAFDDRVSLRRLGEQAQLDMKRYAPERISECLAEHLAAFV